MSITTDKNMIRTIIAAGAVVLGAGMCAEALAQGYPASFGFGSPASAEEISAVDIDAMPDGRGLPPGEGSYETGKSLYVAKCAACHAPDLSGIGDVGGDKLIGGRGSLASGKPVKTIESYWPYATTVFDYVKRAMPFNEPGSLSNDEVYAITAYVLAEANVIGKDQKIDATTLPKVVMPNREGFVPDPRPDVHNYN